MVHAATQANGILLEDAHAWRGLARVHERSLAALEQISNLARVRCNAAHALQVVERGSFSGEQDERITRNACEQLTDLDTRAISHEPLHAYRRIEQVERALEHVESCDHTFLLCDKLDRCLRASWHYRRG